MDRKGTQASLFSVIWSSFALQVSFPVAFLGGVTPSRHDVTAAGGGAGPGGAAAPSAGTGLRAHGGQTPRRARTPPCRGARSLRSSSLSVTETGTPASFSLT